MADTISAAETAPAAAAADVNTDMAAEASTNTDVAADASASAKASDVGMDALFKKAANSAPSNSTFFIYDRAATNIDNHGTYRFMNRHPSSQSGSHWLFN